MAFRRSATTGNVSRLRVTFVDALPRITVSCYALKVMQTSALDVHPVDPSRLESTPNLFQSPLWARFKSKTGDRVKTFGLGSNRRAMLVQLRGAAAHPLAYVPAGPDVEVPTEDHGFFLEELSVQLRKHLPESCPAVRYDLPWVSPYDPVDPPVSAQAAEIRMNFGTSYHNIHKAPTDSLAPDTVEIDLSPSEHELLAAMRPKTRYNIRLSQRHGVDVETCTADHLSEWHALYTDTARRKGFRAHEKSYFEKLFSTARRGGPSVHFYLARHRSITLGGIIVVHTRDVATYLYGASAAHGRSVMAPYALQWHAMRAAKAAGCTLYDTFGIPPSANPGHPMYGLYRFKTGFGGSVVHRRGAWDFVYNSEAYAVICAGESASSGYYS